MEQNREMKGFHARDMMMMMMMIWVLIIITTTTTSLQQTNAFTTSCFGRKGCGDYDHFNGYTNFIFLEIQDVMLCLW